jgi:hypothetical protein
MPEQDPITPEEAELHEVLCRLKPKSPPFDLSRIALVAQQRQWRQIWRWRGIAAFLAAGIVVSSLLRGGPRVVYVQRPEPAANVQVAIAQASPLPELPPLILEGDNYLALRSRVMVFGLRALRSPSGPPAPQEAPIKLFGPLDFGDHL